NEEAEALSGEHATAVDGNEDPIGNIEAPLAAADRADSADADADAVGHGAAVSSRTARRGKRESADPTLLVYQRYDVATTLHLTVPIPGSSIPETVDDQGAL